MQCQNNLIQTVTRQHPLNGEQANKLSGPNHQQLYRSCGKKPFLALLIS
jgi:hypothetical protein